MPVLSLFYGIIVRMYSEPNGKHKMPHLHAEYQGKEAVFDFDGNLLEGTLPNKQKKYMAAWIAIHEDDLKANWELLQNGQEFFRIPPLQ
ncbi:MAG: DUF4160 domain-containing protein [Lachnospiraceae bacterium]|nr:DUF4160 domain-containing protein [Lachnospiraceae bacterium]